MPEHLPLAAGVHGTACGDDAVFLDERADVYLCLPGRADVLVGTSRAVVAVDPTVLDRLKAAGLLAPADTPPGRASSKPRPPRPAASAMPPVFAPPSPGHALEALRSLAEVALFYRGRSFAQILRRVRIRAAETEAWAPRAGLREVVERFHAWVPYAPVGGKCLLRSFMLLRLLQEQGLRADWVFGVRTWPFAAHCWLQVEDLVLDDYPERLDAFTPILVV